MIISLKPLRYAFCVILTGVLSAHAQSLSGLQIGDPLSTVAKIGLEPASINRTGQFTMVRWEFPDGNELSITSVNNRIIYMESDWGKRQAGSFTDFPGIIYGRTTLDELRRLFGSNGFCYTDRGCSFLLDGGSLYFNSYEFTGDNDTVITFITRDINFKFPPKSGDAVVDAIIVGYPPYLDGIWGSSKVFDPEYKPIDLQ